MSRKLKKNISIQSKVVQLGQKLAHEDRRDFSALVEVLILAEARRRRLLDKAA